MQKYLIEGPWSGELAIIPRPRGSDWLEDEVRALKDEGFALVVSFLTGDEAEELGLLREAEVIRDNGLEFWNFTIPDLGVPASREAATKFLEKLHQLLLAGKKIAIHCRGKHWQVGLSRLKHVSDVRTRSISSVQPGKRSSRLLSSGDIRTEGLGYRTFAGTS
jgi:hypothetical protein